MLPHNHAAEGYGFWACDLWWRPGITEPRFADAPRKWLALSNRYSCIHV